MEVISKEKELAAHSRLFWRGYVFEEKVEGIENVPVESVDVKPVVVE
jgi:hypothetical protein